tara:strand:- start:579 stop:797 length:219 start_codon:yes stop_codon:yes gene_type:complete
LINIEIDVRTAAAIRQVLFGEQKIYTHDPNCTPPRITDIRNVVDDLDKQIEVELEKAIQEQTEEKSDETTNT